MSVSIPLQKAARILRRGGVVAYPTEGLYGLGCLPGERGAVERILAIKKRDVSQGLILIASAAVQLEPWAILPEDPLRLRSDVEQPVTWVIGARSTTPPWLRGRHNSIAVRITAHPVAAALCDAAGSALVSTSANVAGQAPARNALVLRRRFGPLVDCIVPGDCGPAPGASEIRDLESGKVLRPGGKQ